MANVKELNINSKTYDIVGKAVVDENNAGTPIKTWTGTSANLPVSPSSDTLYYVTDTKQILLGSTILSDGLKKTYDLFDFKWTDHILTDQSWLRADTFSWQDGTVYSEAYQHLVDDYDNAPATPTLEFLPLAENVNLGSNNWRDIAYDGEKFVAISLGGKISTSTDGITWSAATTVSELSASSTWVGICYGNGMFVATSGDGYFSTSLDGTTWSQATFGATVEKPGFGRVVYGNGMFVTISLSPGTCYIYTSEDGSNWDYEGDLSSSEYNFMGIAFKETKFVAISAYGYVSTSTNGSVWTTPTVKAELTVSWFNNICYDGSKFVAFSENGYISTSDDGLTWTAAVQKSNLHRSGSNVFGVSTKGTTIVVLTDDGYTSTSANISTETIGSYTITYVLAADKHKITTDETTAANIYTESGVAWYYVLDKANTRFKLPRTKYGFNGFRDEVGKYIPETLPNINGKMTITGKNTSYLYFSEITGAFTKSSATTTGGYRVTGESASTAKNPHLIFDASNSSSTYQNNAPVQERATQMYLYFYIGQFSQSATEQTAGLNASLFNNKADLDLGNLDATGKKVIDGQFVDSYLVINNSTITTVGSYTYNLSSYLPDDGQKYEVYVHMYGNPGSTASDCGIYSDIFTLTAQSISFVQLHCVANVACPADFIIPVGAERKIYYFISNSNFSSLYLRILGYRRMGTNS